MTRSFANWTLVAALLVIALGWTRPAEAVTPLTLTGTAVSAGVGPNGLPALVAHCNHVNWGFTTVPSTVIIGTFRPGATVVVTFIRGPSNTGVASAIRFI
jgi:hypothetical protein